jgi:hypothetical protein
MRPRPAVVDFAREVLLVLLQQRSNWILDQDDSQSVVTSRIKRSKGKVFRRTRLTINHDL